MLSIFAFVFTFHYVSIISLPSLRQALRHLHLHSIMFLLFPKTLTLCCRVFLIYIPLCFYYFPLPTQPDKFSISISLFVDSVTLSFQSSSFPCTFSFKILFFFINPVFVDLLLFFPYYRSTIIE